jgi:hypothetical protein
MFLSGANGIPPDVMADYYCKQIGADQHKAAINKYPDFVPAKGCCVESKSEARNSKSERKKRRKKEKKVGK